MKCTLATLALIFFAATPVAAQKQAPVDEYAIHADGRSICNPLSPEAMKTGKLKKRSAV